MILENKLKITDPAELVMERSLIKDLEIKELLKGALTDKIHDRELFMKGIDNSYSYEWYILLKTDEV